MKVKTKEVKMEDINQIEKRLIVEIDPQYYKDEFEKTIKDVIKNVAIKGFRPGKVPRSIVERLYGNEIKEDVIHKIEKEFIEEYIEENKIEIVSKINPTHNMDEKNLRFEYHFEVKPVIAPSNYRGIEVKGRKVEVTEDEVNNVIEDILERYSNVVPANKENVEKGDVVKITLTEHKDSKMIGKPLYLELNEKKTKKFIIDALDGKKLNDEIEVNVAEDSQEKMKIKIDEIKKIERPVLDDEFVKKYLQMESVEALKKDITDRIREKKENQEKEKRFDSIIKEIIVRNPFPVPPSMVERSVERYVHDMEESSNRKFSKEERDAIANSARDNITYEIQKYLIMDAIGKLEGIDINDDDLEAYFKKIADESGENVIKVKAYYEKNNMLDNVKESLKFEKIRDFLINESRVTIE
ncbi:MAG: trigger factor [Myxococcota bacterium]